MADPTINEMKDAWNAVHNKLKELYNGGLHQYPGWLDSFYSFFGVDDWGEAKVEDLKSFAGAEPSSEQLQYWLAANELANRLNFLKTEVFEKIRAAKPGEFFGTTNLTLVEDWPTVSNIADEQFHTETLAPLVNQIVQDIKVLLENPLISAPDLLTSLGGPFEFGTAPPAGISDLLYAVRDTSGAYLKYFSDFSVTLKKDIQPLPESNALAPASIFSDPNLEYTLDPGDIGGLDYYIGLLLDPKMTNRTGLKKYSDPYLPVRYAPNEENLSGWDDKNYSLVERTSLTTASLVQTDKKESRGIVVPLGLGITVAEIVESETGTWVGFTSDRLNIATKNGKKLLYTHAKYVRITEQAATSRPAPYLSNKILNPNNSPNAQCTRADGPGAISGAQRVNPKENENWVTLDPLDVRLEYYNFLEHHKRKLKDDLVFTRNSIINDSSLRYSEGYYYFIRGEAPRDTEESIIENHGASLENDQQAMENVKREISVQTIETLKQEAWKNLLNYLNKHNNPSDNIQKQLYEKYFVVAGSKINTNSVNPNNQKVLFAINSSYVDSIPSSKKRYINNFEEGSEFANGRNFTISMNLNHNFLNDLKTRCVELARIFTKIKNKINSSNNKIQNPNDLDYDINIQIEVLENLPNILNQFFARQAFPATTSQDFISNMISEGTNTNDSNVIQIGIRDNGAVGGDVRETISYIIFSPDPKKLLNSGNPGEKGFNLFYFDPYITESELSTGLPSGLPQQGAGDLKRSGVPLTTGMPLLRQQLSGVYGSRALHLVLFYDDLKKKLSSGDTSLEDAWIEFLQTYSVPPLKIGPGSDPRRLQNREQLDCEAIMRRLDMVGPFCGPEEQILLDKLYGDEQCMKRYFDQFMDATPATDPSLSKKELEKIAQISDNKNNSSFLDNHYINLLYTKFFNVLDPQALISLIMACLQKQLGLEITAEAICEAAIIELVKSLGVGEVEKIIIANALLAPNTPLSVSALEALGAAPPPGAVALSLGEPLVDASGQEITPTAVDKSWNDAPIATALVTSGSPTAANIIQAIKNLEKGGTYIDLVPGKRPVDEDGLSIPVPYGSGIIPSVIKNLEDDEEVEYLFVPAVYSQKEINNEIKRLTDQGYSEQNARAKLVELGMLVPSPEQYESLLSGEAIIGPLDKATTALAAGATHGAVDYSTVEHIRANTQDAENWLAYMKSVVSLGGLCQLIVGHVLDGLEDLIKNPGAFVSNFEGGWWATFKEKLKRQFSPPEPTMRFPDNLMTDSHMGDYTDMLLQAMVSMVATILGQIIDLLIRQALEACLEERPGPGPEPVTPTSTPLPDLQRVDLPKVGNLSDEEVVDWIKDLMDNLNPTLICSLLRGDASDQTLYDCLVRTTGNWPNVLKNGVESIHEIRAIFETIGKTLNLDICNLLETGAPVDNLCESFFDRDARCAQLKSAGLTEEECQKQVDQEVDDLKSKVSGLVPLAFDKISPFKSMPSMCGENGIFQIPPGIQDTMQRVTDNMLTHIKGSLIQDLSTLKFFATPPRAILAVTDPEELKKAYKMFEDAAKNPYKRKCVALIADPRNFDVAGGDSGTRAYHGKNIAEIYPVTYNRYIHFGNFSTWSDEGAGSLGASALFGGEPGDETTKLNKADLEATLNAYGSVGVSETNLTMPGLAHETIKEQIRDYHKHYSAQKGDDDFFELEEMRPLHAGMLTRITDDGIPYIPSSTLRENNDKTYIKGYFDSLFEEFGQYTHGTMIEKIDERVLSDFSKQIKDMGTENLVITVEQIMGASAGGGGCVYTTEEDSDLWGHEGKSYKNNFGAFPGHLRIGGGRYGPGSVVKKVWPLHKKLKEIDSNPLRWYSMLRHFTGVDLHPLSADNGDKDWHSAGRNMDRIIVAHAMENDPPPYDDLEGWQEWLKNVPTERDAWSHTAGITDDERVAESGGVLDLKWVAWLQISPGLRYLLPKIVEVRKRAETGPGANTGYQSWAYDASIPELQQVYNWWRHTLPELYETPGVDILNNDVGDRTEHRWAPIHHAPGADEGTDQPINRKRNHNIAIAFMELTVAEALGLEKDRFKEIFPNMSMPSDGVIFGAADRSLTHVVKWTDASETITLASEGKSTRGELAGFPMIYPEYYPFYIVFEKQFRDPDSLLNGDPNDIIDHFSMDKEKVNKELYDALSDANLFRITAPDRIAGFEDHTLDEYEDFKRIDYSPLFNPNSLIYPLPFTEIIGRSAAGISGAEKTQEILDIFRGNITADDQVNALIESLEAVNKNHSILYQNVSLPLEDNVNSQISGLKDVLTIAKGKMWGEQPPDIVNQKEKITDTKFVLDFQKDFDDDIKKLLEEIYQAPGHNPGPANAETALAVFEEETKDLQYNVLDIKAIAPPDMVGDIGGPVGIGMQSPFTLDGYNFKAQIFGKLLTHKFMQTFWKYFDQSKSVPSNVGSNKFQLYLQHILSTYGFSGLQYAYSSQMFSKLRNSRLQNRGFMKKLWKAILKSPISSAGGSGSDPRCQEVFDQLSLIPKSDLNKTETDFFNLESVKEKILKFYKSSLCQDVYEKSKDEIPYPGTEMFTATQTSLMEGIVMLLVKIYTLEICLASVIAWDSFKLSDVLEDELTTKIIIDNIRQNYDINMISYFCNDIIRKEEGVTEIQKNITITPDQSGLRYMIGKEAKNIAASIEKLFNNSSPLTTDLSLEIIKNSDPDFEKEFTKKVIWSTTNQNPEKLAALYDNANYDYVVSARMPENIYTMNYGSGKKIRHGSLTDWETRSPDSIDLFGYYGDGNYNKNFFHSLPMTYYTTRRNHEAFFRTQGPQPPNYPGYVTSDYADNDNDVVEQYFEQSLPDPYKGPSEAFTTTFSDQYITWQNTVLGGADPWNKENFQELLFGNGLNAKLGNITINPYVRIVLEEDCQDYVLKHYTPVDQSGDPCQPLDGLVTQLDLCDYEDEINELFVYMREGNPFGCYIDGYVPLSVWSYFYNNVFLQKINTYYDEGKQIFPLKELFTHFGLKPFFKEISFGLRLSYSTSYPIVEAEGLEFDDFVLKSFNNNAVALKKVKSLVGQRPYRFPNEIPRGSHRHNVLRELQIPIVEVERAIHSQVGAQGFTVGDSSELISMNELGFWTDKFDDFAEPFSTNTSELYASLISSPEVAKFLINTPDQFFYKNLASDLLFELKNTAEFRLMFDHLLPMRKYMALAFMYAGEGLSKFIPEPTDILSETKDRLKTVLDALVNSSDYQHMPDPIAEMLQNHMMRQEGGTTGKEPDMRMQILKIVFMTPLLILKGFVEVTDPAVIISKTIIDIARAVQQTVLSAVEQALKASRQVIQISIQAAEAALSEIDMQARIAVAPLTVAKSLLPDVAANLITIEDTDKSLDVWNISMEELPDNVKAELTEKEQNDWDDVKNKFDEIKEFQDSYSSAKIEINNLVAQKQKIDEEIETHITDAKKTMKDLFGSPFLLPGMWAALFPSIMPFFGGLVPPPLVGGPPSSFPGMIYIALLLIDAYEEKIHDELYSDDPNCEDEL